MKYVFIIVCMIFHLVLGAQINYDKFPVNNSLIPRDISNNNAYISFTFSDQLSTNPSDYKLLKFKNDTLVNELAINITPASNKLNFAAQDTIEASLNAYSYQLFYQDSLIKEAKNICAGDVYILHGQSNAESRSRVDSCYADYSNYIRTYGNASETGYEKKWEIATGDGNRNSTGHVGQLGIALGQYIISSNNVPVCIINGAVGAKEITYFLPDTANKHNSNTAFGRLLNRTLEANITNNVRAIIWYQGENDAYMNTTKETYIKHFSTLYNAWKKDFSSLENVYVFQIKNGCNLTKEQVGEIQSAQLEFKNLFENIEIISTTNIEHASDTCHYNYYNGYKILGKKLYDLINYYQYNNQDESNIYSPSLDYIEYNNNTIFILLIHGESLFYEPDIFKNFYINENNEHAIAISKNENVINLLFNTTLNENIHLSYSCENGNIKPSIYNEKNNGLLCFYNMKINKPKNIAPIVTKNYAPYIYKDILHFYSTIQEEINIDILISSTDGKTIKKINDKIYQGENQFELNLPNDTIFLVEIIAHYKSGDKKYLMKAKK